MKGKKLVIALLLSLIVCLVIIPTCAFADNGEPAATQPEAAPAPAMDTGASTDGGGTGTTPTSGTGEVTTTEGGTTQEESELPPRLTRASRA